MIVVGLAGSGLACLAFGFSPSYRIALCLRLICGSINGIIGVTKSYLSEITDETNQAQGFALIGLNRALGLIVGPVVGVFDFQDLMYFRWIPGSYGTKEE